jgi:hypothetical protein
MTWLALALLLLGAFGLGAVAVLLGVVWLLKPWTWRI